MTTLQVEKKQVLKEDSPQALCFEAFESGAAAGNPGWLKAIRQNGISHFLGAGFPTLKQEEWQYTNVDPIVQMPFKPVFQSSGKSVTREMLKQFELPLSGIRRMVFVDGHFVSELSDVESIPGLIFQSLASAIKSGRQGLEKQLARQVEGIENPFSALNTAFFQDGLFVEVEANRSIDTPIHLLYIATASGMGATYSPRNLILANRNSEFHWIESYVSLKDGVYLTNAVTEVVLDEGAKVEHCKIQNESQKGFHLATIQIHQETGSHFTSHSISTGARICRNDIGSVLNGKGAECVFNGLYLGHEDQLVDHHTVIDHAKPYCNSYEFYHGILGGQSRGVFNGKIFVRKDAQKTDAKQTNKGVLLSDSATLDTKPQLEIFADDVKCTHGATVGQLDEDALFYLQARGIGVEMAKRMLIFAFASDILNRISLETVRNQISQFITSRLKKDYADVKE